MLILLSLACSVSTPKSQEAPSDGELRSGMELVNANRGKTFEAPNMKLVFDDEHHAVMTWPNMGGEPVHGKISLRDPGYTIVWDTNAENTLNLEFHIDPTTACTQTMVKRVQRVKGEEEVSIVFRQTDPACED